jgi:hypothetical protein
MRRSRYSATLAGQPARAVRISGVTFYLYVRRDDGEETA